MRKNKNIFVFVSIVFSITYIFSCSYNEIQVYEMIKENKASTIKVVYKNLKPEEKKMFCRRALLYSVKLNKKEMINYFLSVPEKDVNYRYDNGDTLLMYATNSGDLENIKMLLENNASINMKNGMGESCLTKVLSKTHGYRIDIVEFLIKNKIKVFDIDFLKACARGDFNVVKLLYNKEINVNSKDEYYEEMSPLMVTSGKDCEKIVNFLLSNGANINAGNENGDTALMVALKKCQYKKAKILIQKGADVNIVNSDEETALMIASMNDCPKKEVVELLITSGAKINAKDSDGWTALTYALNDEEYEIVSTLLMRNCKISDLDKKLILEIEDKNIKNKYMSYTK